MKIDNKNKITRNALEDMYPLAPMQQGILFHSLYAPQSGVYFMQLSVTLHGNLNVAAFQRTWQEIQQRHPILRTAFNWEHREEPFQIVYRQAKLHWHEHDWRTFSRQEQIEQLQTFIQADREKGFDLTRAPLMRLNLIRLADESYHFLWSHHHLLLDGWSCGLLLKEVFGLYELLQAEKSGAFSPCPPYGDYISWLQRQDMTQARAYWQRTLQGFHTATPLPAEQNNTGWQTREEESATQKIALSPQLTESLQQFSKQQSLTVNTLLQAAWALLLKNYTGKKDVIFGTVVSGRPLEIEHIETMVGLFCNTLPTRIQMHDDETLLPWLKTIQQQQAEQRQFEHSPLLQIQRWSDMPRGSSLFDSIMVFENYPMDKYMQDQVHSLTIEDAHFLERTNYPFSIQAIPGEDLLIRLDYDRRRFSDEAIQRLLRHLQTLLETFIAHPEYQLWQVSPLTQEERHQILVAWNETAQTYPQEQCLPQLFEAQVERSPHALALRFQQQELTYAQLNAQANQLAHALIQLGVGPERIVALHLQRCPELVIAILAVLKAEGAYLPLEPSLPGERVSTLLQQSRPHLVLTQQHLRSLLPEDQSPIFCLETLWPQLQALPTSNPPCSILPAHLAYVLFTSGSTGLPKGVMIPHQGLVNYLSWAISAYQADAGNGSPVHSPLGFDLTVTSLFTPLLCGRPVLLLPPSHELEALLDVLQQGPHFSLLKLTPAHLTLLNQWLTPEQAATCTQALIVGGEELLGEQVRFWQERAPNVRLINEYGPTETVVGCCTYEVPAHEHFTSGIPIGRPIANTQLYVLDPFLQPVPPEVAGELYIGGAGLARGYFQQADLSAERFVPHPFSHQPGARLYRTGDLASYQQDGTLTFLGRIDQQVKLRGYRIELGEIENVLAQHALVQDTVVLLREDHPGDKRLVAYVVPAREIANLGQFTGILQQYMRERLPEYMLPVAFVLLEQLPLTANGKIDRQSLPEPEERRSTQQNFVATRSPIQQQLGVLWEEVLKIDTVGIHDNFFALGGHSLLLTQLATRIRKTFQLDLPLPTLFQAATLAHMTEALENALREQHHLPPEEPILPVARDQALPLSFAQQRLWFLQQLNPDSSAYTIPVFVRLSGKLSLSALEQALNYVIQRHETLRTTFSTDNNQAVQIIQPYTYFTLLIVDLTVSAPTAEHVQRILGEEAMRPFDLTHELPWRACLYRQSADEHVLAFCMHHIVSDAWSSGILVQEISTFYAHLCAGMSAELPDLTVQYADFAVWQRGRLQGENLRALHSYWRKQLADAPEVLNLPTDYARPTMQTFQGSTEHFVLLPELTHELNRLAHKEQVTLFMLLIAAFNVLLYHYSQQSDILLGVPIANRTREETEKLIGVFMNTLVLRHQLQPQQSFRELLTVVRNTTLEAYAHQDLPFEALIEELAPARSMGHHPLFQVMFVLQNAPMPAVELTDLHIQSLEIENGMTKFDLTLFMEEQADGLRGMFEYNTALFKASTIRRFQEHFCSLLQRIVQEPKELIWRLTPLDEAEQQVILYQWNETEHEYPQEQCLPQLFEAQVERSPHALALCFQQQELTYAQLNAQANQLAHALIQLGVGPELIVALHLQRCPELVIAILAVLKAGGAYLPLEPSLPGERLSTLLQQSQPYLVLTQQHLCALLPEDQSPIFCLEALWPQLQALPTCNPTCSILPAHLAYVLFTSGSTGLPKGVMIPHQGLVNYLSWATSAYQADAGNGSPIHSPLGFDLTVTSLFTPLLCGRPVLLLPPSHELEALLDVLQQGPHFSLLKLTPAHLTLLNQWLTPEQAATCTQALIVGGEELLGEQVRFWQEHAPNVRLINEYGPTETVVGCCTYEVPAHEHFTSGIPIGRPIANTQLYVLDPFLQPVPPGVAGELYIGGAGLARGYFQQADLSAARFVPHPFSREAGARLYRTGDLASYQQNGTLTFLGRIDQQVKLRGYRIELGEIENVLKQHLLIQDAVVLLREDHPGDKRLVAYVVPAPETTDQQREHIGQTLQNYLSERLPEYMVPGSVLLLAALPLTANGKIERKALPVPTYEQAAKGEQIPQGLVEQQLALLWGELLGTSPVALSDNFFALGGHSLLLTQLAIRIRSTFRLELSLRELFQSAQFADMAAFIHQELREQRQLAPLEPIIPVTHTQALPLSFAQQRLWFLQQLEPENAAYNIPFLIRLNGIVATEALEQTLQEIIARHEILRTTYAGEHDEPAQIIATQSTFMLHMINLTHLPMPERADELRRQAIQEGQRSFDLRSEQPIRAMLLKIAEEEHILLLNLHHIASDGWSTGIIVQEVASLYPAFLAGEPSPLSDLSIQYADYAAWQRSWLQGDTLQRLLAYWQTQLADVPPVLHLPYDHPRPTVLNYKGATRAFVLTQELTQALDQLARQEQVTLFMLLLASFQLLLHNYSRQEDILVGTPIANRTRQETEQLIGAFMNTLVMRARIKRQHTFRELLSQVRETTLEAYAYQDLPFETLVEALAPARNMGHHPLFQVMFVLQNAPVQEITLPDIVLQPLELDTGIAKFDLTLAMEEGSDGLQGTIEYSTELFAAETINRLIGHFQVILESIVADPGQALWQISLLTQQEQLQLLHTWNRTEKEYPRERCVTQLIAEQAARSPEAVAVICGEERLCYRELEERANQLAHYLQKLGVGPEILVGIHLPRSIDLLVAVLGILKAGGAYVPLEIGLPPERLALLLQRTRMPVVITQQYLQEKLPVCDANILALDAISTSLAEQPTDTPENRFAPEHLAYILYTSGSTGEPKGVMVPHQGLTNYLCYSKERYGAAEGHGSPVHSPLGFDLTVTSIFTPLLLGQSVELLPQEYEVDSLQTVLSQHKRYSLVKLTPAHLMLLNQWLQPEDAAESAYTLVIGGEELRHEQLAFWQTHAPNVRLINEYGPTETVVGCCVYEAQSEERDEVVPIGRPINNTQLYLLDAHYQLVPPGIPGELYIGGAGVTRGYFQQPDLTAERYVPHPYSQKGGERLYRTGDLACYRADGNLIFLGRIDQQVKLRGYRIELGEIENVLMQHPQVQEVLVIVREDQQDDKRLVAYVVPAKEHDEETLLDELQQHMHAQLPGYMLPTHTLLLDELPLTANGKVDRKALPVPELRESEQEEQQLQTAYEQQLALFWQTLLRVERVSPNSNFFELGGHSLLLTQLATRIRSTFHVELPLRQLFQAATLVQMANLIADAQRGQQQLVDLAPIQPASREQPLPLSFAQQRLWFLQQFDTNNSAYNIPLLVRLTGDLKKEALELALTTVITRHELLRTTFSTMHGEPVQVVQQEQAFKLPLIDLASLPSETQAEDFQQIAAHEVQQPFDLELDSPIRGSLLKIAEQEHILLLTLHHIVSDAWSTSILIQEVATIYTAEVTGKPSMLPVLPVQYADFALWQRNWLQGATMEALLGYWKAALTDAPPLLTLPTDRPRPAIQTYRGTTLPFVLTQELSAQLAQLARSEQVTMFMLLLSAFALLLHVYSHQDDIVIGTPIANRTREEAEQLIGVFINTLALRTHVERKDSFRQLLQQVRESTLEAYAHQDLPFEALVDALAPERNLSYHPLFQVMFVLQNTPQSTIELPDLQLQAIEPESTIAKFDLSLSLEENKEGLRGTLEYNTDLFTSTTIARMLSHFQSILQAIVATTAQPMWQISPLTQWERNLLLVDWNQTGQAYPQDLCLHELFAAQVKRSPTAIAVMCENEQLTYHELNEQADALAHLLRERGVQADSAVGICLERSLSMVIAIFGVLKAGGAYVPLDPGYPQERLAFMLAQARVPLLLTTQALAAQFTAYAGEIICIDNLPPSSANAIAEYKGKTTSPDNLAYLLYTSGSTGQPKGVMISHRAICNHMHWFLEAFPLDSTDRVLQKTPFSFDASVWEFYAPLLSGGTLVMAQPGGHQDSAYMLQAIKDYHITTLQLVPSQLQMLVEEPQFVTCHSLRWLFCGGEELPIELYHKTLDLLPVEMHNLYGPSETCIDAITWHCRTTQELNSTPIGRPIANMQAYVLDEFMQLTPLGVPGELYLGGVDLARGYMQRPELTAARFVPHPFSTNAGERLYRTGDLVRYLPDSTLQYLGRMDQQVKVRGFRIEPGEIEAVLNQHPLTQECAVIVREDHPGDRRLVAYLVFRAQPAPSNSELRQFLLNQLPGYMVPSYFVTLEQLPLQPNGKIARTQLPAPSGARPEQEQAYIAPRTAIEQSLTDIWAAVLGIELIGINDNFFELGGDSILSIQIIARANEAGLRLTPKQIFQHQTIAQLAEVINQAPATLAEQGPVTGAVSLTPIQHWFFAQNLYEPHHWNQAMFLEVRQKLDSAILEQALQRLMSQHDALRMRFTREAHGWQQVNQDEEQSVQLLQFDLSEKTAHEQTTEMEHVAAQLQASLHLAEGQLIRVALFHLGELQPARLLVVLHHLIIDGVSWIILLEDLQTVYQQLSRGKAARLPSKTSSYQQWAQQLTSYAQSEELQQELDYWRKVAHEAVPLPLDFADGTNLEGTGETVSITLSKEETGSLLQKVPATYHTEINDVLLTALAHACAPWLKTRTLLLDLEGHGREPLFEEIDLSRTIGWFTSIYPVALNLGESGKPWEELKLIKEQLRAIPHHGIGYGLLRYLSAHEETRKALQTQAQAEISFNYFGQFDQSFAGSSLFRTAAESSGPVRSLQGQRHYKVEVTGYVEGGELHMSWRYSTKLHRRSSITQLAERFQETLQDLIRHCEEEDVEGYTPSDFPAAALSQKDLDKLLNKLNQPKRNRNRA